MKVPKVSRNLRMQFTYNAVVVCALGPLHYNGGAKGILGTVRKMLPSEGPGKHLKPGALLSQTN